MYAPGAAKMKATLIALEMQNKHNLNERARLSRTKMGNWTQAQEPISGTTGRGSSTVLNTHLAAQKTHEGWTGEAARQANLGVAPKIRRRTNRRGGVSKGEGRGQPDELPGRPERGGAGCKPRRKTKGGGGNWAVKGKKTRRDPPTSETKDRVAGTLRQ